MANKLFLIVHGLLAKKELATSVAGGLGGTPWRRTESLRTSNQMTLGAPEQRGLECSGKGVSKLPHQFASGNCLLTAEKAKVTFIKTRRRQVWCSPFPIVRARFTPVNAIHSSYYHSLLFLLTRAFATETLSAWVMVMFNDHV